MHYDVPESPKRSPQDEEAAGAGSSAIYEEIEDDGCNVPEPKEPPPPLPPQSDVYDLDVSTPASPQRQAPPPPGGRAPPPLPMRRPAPPPAVPAARPSAPPPLPARPTNNPQ